MSRVRCLGYLLVAALVSWSLKANAAAAPLSFVYGIPSSDQVNIYVAQDMGLFKKVGLDPKFYLFQSGAPLLAGLKSGSIDVVTTGLAVAFALGQGIPLKILYWTDDDSKAEGLVTQPNGPVKSYKDLSPKTKIAAASGTCAQVAMFLIAQKLGIKYDKFDIINLPAPLMHNALLSKSIDAGIAWAPYSVQLKAEKFPAVNWDTAYTPPGGMCPRTTAVRPAFLKEHPDIGVKLLQVDKMAAQMVAKDPQLAVNALVKRLALSPAVAKADIERNYMQRPTYSEQLDPNSPYSMTSKTGGLVKKLIDATNILYKVGAIPAPISESTIRNSVDPSTLERFMAASKGG